MTRTTPTGVPIEHCTLCGFEHPVTRPHCDVCGKASLFPHNCQKVPTWAT